MFLISNFICLLLVCKKPINFCLLTLYPTTLLQLLIHSRRILFIFFLIFYIANHVICDKGSFIFSFSICIVFISFSGRIALSRTSSIMLTRSHKGIFLLCSFSNFFLFFYFHKIIKVCYFFLSSLL